MKKIFVLFTLIFCVVASQAFSQSGKITGLVYNGSADSATVAGLDVELLVYQGHSLIDDSTYTNKTNSRGEFSFTSIPIDTTKTYYPRTMFSNVVYYARGARFFSGHNVFNSDIVVYDTTSQKSKIMLQLEHLFIETEPERINVREIFIINNLGNKTYVGQNYDSPGDNWILKFPLPNNFHDLEILTPEAQQSVFIKDQALMTTDLLSPGSRQLSFRYHVPQKSKNWHYIRPIEYPIGEVNIFVSNPDITLEGPGVMPMGSFPIRNIDYKRYSVRSLMPGMSLELTVTNIPGKSINWKWIVLIAVGVLLIIGFGYTLRKS